MTARLAAESAARTHVGRVRRLNEDSFVERVAVGLWAVADGMGGHAAGEVASGLIAERLGEVERAGSGYALLEAVRERLNEANRALMDRAAQLSPGSVIGSTVAALLVHAGHYACVWAGDSRVYLLRGGRLELLTRDHSMVQELLDAGTLQPEDARAFGRSNIITRAVGVAEPLELEMRQGPLQPGDLFLLCSDGLHGMLDDAEIAGSIAGAPSLAAAADTLIARTLESGARDNVTVVLVRIVRDPEATLDLPGGHPG